MGRDASASRSLVVISLLFLSLLLKWWWWWLKWGLLWLLCVMWQRET